MEPKIAEWKPEPMWLRIYRYGSMWVLLAVAMLAVFQLTVLGIDGVSNAFPLLCVFLTLPSMWVDSIARRRLPKPKQAVYFISNVAVSGLKDELGTDTGYLWFEGRLMRFEGVRVSLSIDMGKVLDTKDLADKPKSFDGWQIEGTDCYLSICTMERVPCSGKTWSSTDLFELVKSKEIDPDAAESWPPEKPFRPYSLRFRSVYVFCLFAFVIASLVSIFLNFSKRGGMEIGLAGFTTLVFALFAAGMSKEISKERRVAQG